MDKKCIICKEVKSIDNFRKKGKYRDTNCNECRNKEAKENRDSDFKCKSRKCTGCEEVKPITEYHLKKGKANARCKACVSEQMRLSYLKKKGKPDLGVGRIFDETKRLLAEGKALSEINTNTEAWKLANGYSWVTIEVQVTKTVTRKQRVLRKLKKNLYVE